MKKHFRSTEKVIYIDEFVELLYQEFKKLFSGLHFTDVEFVKQELARKLSLNEKTLAFNVFNLWTKSNGLEASIVNLISDLEKEGKQ